MYKQNFLVEITGAHGTGKTTLIEGLEKFYKEKGKPTLHFLGGEIARQVSEFGIPINEHGSDLSQCIIFSGILERLTSGLFNFSSNHIVFSDRSLICPATYSKVLNTNSFILNKQLSMLELFYKKIKERGVLFYLPVEFGIEDDGVRSVNKDFQKQIDENIVLILKGLRIPYYKLVGSVEERVQSAIKIIDEKE